ncbi:tyrosine-type recombinase/integrase [Clostridioides difficile]|nr:tyrosine-type recombinase/integrase [Clostridioides difficile]
MKNELYLICLNKRFNLWVQPTFVAPFKELLIDNNLRDIKLHKLRHANATLILLSSTNIKSISEILGHADIKITMNRCSHLLYEMDNEASENTIQIMFSFTSIKCQLKHFFYLSVKCQ